jgi:hypothetical protein
MIKSNTYNTFDRTVYSLCNEIDSLVEEVEYWKGLYEAEVAKNRKELTEQLETAKRNVGTALLFAMSVQDDENGNLIIPKAKRKALANQFK